MGKNQRIFQGLVKWKILQAGCSRRFVFAGNFDQLCVSEGGGWGAQF
jgi:hypothetical protein